MQHYSFPLLRLVMGHALAWSGYTGAIYAINLANRTSLSFAHTMLIVMLLMLVFYPVLWMLYRFFPAKKYMPGILALVTYLLLPLPAIYYLAIYRWYPSVGAYLPLEHVIFSVREFFTNYGVAVVRATAYALVYYNVERKITESRERHRADIEKSEAENKMLQTENDKLKFEMAALSVQVSPHLLTNVFYKLYETALLERSDFPDRLLLLAELAAYATEATRPEGELVMVEEELEVIRKLQQLTDAHIVYADDFNLAESHIPSDVRVPRLVMATLVENAVKYSPKVADPPPIRLALHVSKQELAFCCTNAKGKAYDLEVSTGTGLANLRRRLQIHYGDAATLTTRETPDTFEAWLTIILPIQETSNTITY